MTWRASVLTLFPEMFPGPLGISLAGKALHSGAWALETLDIRGFSGDKHRTVDDAPFGGGAGMVMRADVIDAAIEAASDARPLIYLSPRGAPFDQAKARELAAGPGVTLLCGRYEGVDQRVLDARQIHEISIGDFVLSGGEPGAMIVLDACVRLLPGVMGQAESLAEESFEGGLLEYPHYTRPRVWNGAEAPAVLTSGDHGRVAAWRREQAEAATKERRPDLWADYLRKGEAGAGQ
jgi:tRNA (guanine37-N1)-methyltransferase